MISWKSMDERERAVWAASYAAEFVKQKDLAFAIGPAIETADRAVEDLQSYLRDWPFGEKP